MYVTGCSSPVMVCDRTAPRLVSEASVWRVKCQEKSGACRTGDEERAAFRRETPWLQGYTVFCLVGPSWSGLLGHKPER